MLVLWGGQDISPAIYGRPRLPVTGAPDVLKGRDAFEVALTKRAIKLGLPIFGICRGAQLLCAMAGGILVQHVNGHSTSMNHFVIFKDGTKLPYSSLHHQQMFPWNIDHELLGWTEKRSDVYLGVTFDERKQIKVDPEIVWFPKVRGFAVQGHPEFMDSRHPAVAKTMELFRGFVEL